jgi:antitoxin component YwqK of YwqJK toxin-antitoxin module
VKAEGNYENGKQVGEWKYYHPNAKLEQVGKFNKNGKVEGTWRWYYENSRLLKEESYRNGLHDGMSSEYDENGKIIEEGEYVNDLEEGPWFEVIGDSYNKGNYRDGQRTGVWLCYYLISNGTKTDSIISFKGSFTEDLPDGKQVYYWDNGKIKDEGLFIMGRKEGEWMKYNNDGTLFMMTTYKDGVETRYDGIKIKPPFEKEE